jgi:outer membrane lipoprotein-sorting protein
MNYTGGMGFGTGASGWGSGARGVGSVLVLLGLVAGPARAEPSAGPVAKAAEKQDELSEALAAITKSRASLKTLSVPFTQERELSLLSSKVTSKGSLVLARPDKMRWRLEAPDDATYWVSKAGIAYRTKDGSGKVTSGESGAMAALLDDVLMVVGGDLDRLKARYAMSATREGSLRVLSLLPKLAAVQKMVKLLVVSIDDTGVPKRLVLTEPEGDSTTIVFGEAKKNVAIDPSMLAAPLVRSSLALRRWMRPEWPDQRRRAAVACSRAHSIASLRLAATCVRVGAGCSQKIAVTAPRRSPEPSAKTLAIVFLRSNSSCSRIHSAWRFRWAGDGMVADIAS